MIPEETHYRLLRQLEADPQLSQRALSRTLGVSLGKVNYCLKALMEKGWVKVQNFRDSNNKWAYSYVLTPRGLKRKAEITMAFLRRKQAEYAKLQQEIEELTSELKSQSQPPGQDR